MVHSHPRPAMLRVILAGTALMALAACQGGPTDWDLRRPENGLSTAEAARQATLARPQPDARGVISYPTYQVVVARRGDTVASVAARVGIPAEELARHNGLETDLVLRADEVLALPGGGTGAAMPAPMGGITSGPIDITTLAGGAIDRADASRPVQTAAPAPAPAAGPEPVRHQVQRGETAFAIARRYNVTPKALAEWNGLGPEMMVREGQYLMIPVADQVRREVAAAAPVAVPPPGQGSATPTPPSASQPLPDPAATAAPAGPASPQLGNLRTEASGSARFALPVQGQIIRGYEKRRNEGIDIAAPAGATVQAAADGTVAAITRDTNQVPIMVIRHTGNLMTVYANIDNIAVERGETVTRGQALASVRAGSPSFVHFEVRDGIESVDPMPYLQ